MICKIFLFACFYVSPYLLVYCILSVLLYLFWCQINIYLTIVCRIILWHVILCERTSHLYVTPKASRIHCRPFKIYLQPVWRTLLPFCRFNMKSFLYFIQTRLFPILLFYTDKQLCGQQSTTQIHDFIDLFYF